MMRLTRLMHLAPTTEIDPMIAAPVPGAADIARRAGMPGGATFAQRGKARTPR